MQALSQQSKGRIAADALDYAALGQCGFMDVLSALTH